MIFFQHTDPFEDIGKNFHNRLICNLILQQWRFPFRIFYETFKNHPFLQRELKKLFSANRCRIRFHHFQIAGIKSNFMLFRCGQSPSDLIFLTRDLLIDCKGAFGKAIHQIFWNPLNFKPLHIAAKINCFRNVIAKLPAFSGKCILIYTTAITDRPTHFRIFQSLEFSIGIHSHIADHIMCMKLRIKSPACIMMKRRIDDFSGRFMILRIDIFTISNPYRSKLFQFIHSQCNRSSVSIDQPFIENTHD